MRPDQAGKVFKSVSLSDLDHVAESVLKAEPDIRIWLFNGEMGAGKTTTIKAFCRQLGVHDNVSSPTFSIVNEYLRDSGGKVYHFDFYRIRNEREAFDIGVDEYLSSGHYCLIEWPERIPTLIDDRHAEIEISTENENHRTLAYTVK